MQNQSELHVIDGESYEFYMMPPSKALKIFVQIVRRALGPAGAALDGTSLSLAEIFKAKINLNGLLSRLADNVDETWAHQSILQILEHVRHQGGAPVVFEVEFVGRLLHLFKVIGKALEVNYRDFTQGLRGALVSESVPEQAKTKK